MRHDYDVVIIGAGMVGASLACALAPSKLQIAVIEAVELNSETQPSYDDRGITLSPSSRIILQQLNVWEQVSASALPIKRIHVSEQGRFGFTNLSAEEMGYTELGHVVIARALGRALHKKLSEHENIELLCPFDLKQFKQMDDGIQIELSNSDSVKSIKSRLLAGADGSQSLVRRLAGINIEERDYRQTAIVANITTQKPNYFTAFERFTPHGPIALIPIDHNRSVLVFTVYRADAESYLSKSDKEFIDCVEKEFGRRLGRIEQIGQRRSYPIHFIKAIEQYKNGLVLLGNAAHTIHPNAAQGFNLGLRDVAGLTESIFNALENGNNIDDINILKSYIQLREADQERVIQFTNGLANSFYNRIPFLGLARDIAMITLDGVPNLKRSFIENAMGLAGSQPKMIRI